MKNIKWLCLLTILTLAACGGSSTATTDDTDDTDDSDTSDTTAPTVTSVTTDNGGADTALSSTAGDDRVSGATSTGFFTITFSEAMAPETVIADNITLTCNAAAITVGTPATSDNIIWTIPVESNLTGYIACTLTLGVGLTDAAGNALAEAATYAFNTLCSTNDVFIVDTLGFADASATVGNCWNYSVTGSPLPSNSSTSFTVNTLGGGELEFLSPAGSDSKSDFHYLYKTFNALSFIAIVEVVGMAAGGNLDCSLIAQTANGTQSASVVMSSGTNCQLNVNDSSGPGSTCSPTAEAATPNTPLYLQLTWDGTVATGKQGSSLSALTALTTPGSNTTSLGTSYQVGFRCSADAASKSVRVSSFTINAVAVAAPGTQY